MERGELALTTSDGVRLEAEAAVPDGPTVAAMVLCHPHPQFGGSMRSVVTGALFAALPAAGVACLRFNFRGVEGSGGTYGGGEPERLDALAALDHLCGAVGPEVPVIMHGWSFGGDVALSVDDPRHAAWFVVAPPLRFAQTAHLAGDPRPKRVVVAQHDQYRAPEEVRREAATWADTTVEVVGGADHYFIGRSDRLVAVALELAEELRVRR